MLNIFGSYDSRDLDVSTYTLAQYTEEQAMADIRRFQAQYEAIVNMQLSALSVDTDSAKSKFGLVGGGELQPYVEIGETEATLQKPGWEVAYPIYRKRDRKLYTAEYLVRVTLQQLDNDVVGAFLADLDTTRKDILRALMLKTNYTFDDEMFPGSMLGDLPIKRLANNDSATGGVYVDGSLVALGTAQHYIGSNNGTFVVAAAEAAYAKLRTSGHASDVVMWISATDEAAARGFTEFVLPNNPNIINPAKIYAQVQNERAIGYLQGTGVSVEVIVMPFMPAGYFLMFDRSKDKPLARRQMKETEFRGFRLVQDETRTDYGASSLKNKRWERIQGFGVRNRFNGVAVQIVASTTYTDPTIA